jgi:hypothetical protein
MMEQEQRKRRMNPPILSLENDLDLSIMMDGENERKERLIREVMNSNEPIERLAVKSVIVGLARYVHYEDMHYSSGYRRKRGLFGSSEEDWTTKRIKKVSLER